MENSMKAEELAVVMVRIGDGENRHRIGDEV